MISRKKKGTEPEEIEINRGRDIDMQKCLNVYAPW